MQILTTRCLAISGVLICLVGIVSSQITFSKGWGPGKRSSYDDRYCELNTRSVIAAYSTLVFELRQLIACERRRAFPRPGEGTPMDPNVSMVER